MGEKPTMKFPRLFAFRPVQVDERYGYKQPPVQQASWWALCMAWLRYHSIQIRWDIERWLARLFHRRWGG